LRSGRFVPHLDLLFKLGSTEKFLIFIGFFG